MKGVIAAGDPLTAKAGAEILRAGGNAFDAALAAMLAAPMSEPILTSMGGGGFMLAHEAGKRPVLYDFFVDVPPNRENNPDFGPIEVDFGTAVQEFHIGAASIAVPGMIAGIETVYQELGSLPMEQIVAPAHKYASKGVQISRLQADFVRLLEPIMLATEASREIFAPQGKLIESGRSWHNNDYADFLKRFATFGADMFYRGELADKIEKLSVEHGGMLRKEDLQKYKVIKRDPIIFGYMDKKVATNPPPSAGGILIAFALKMLASEQRYSRFESLEYIGDLIESMAAAAEFRSEHIDAHLHKDDLKSIIDDASLLARYQKAKQTRLNLWGNTTHISVIDSLGNAASVTSTNGEGSGYILPGTGIMLNNMLGEEDLNPHGFFQWPAGVRLPSMMAPTMVFDGEDPVLILGSAGSNRIRSAITEVIERYVRFAQPIQEAIESPRVHYERGEVFFEPGFGDQVLNETAKHYKVTSFDDLNLFFGGVNAVTGDYQGAADPRRGGAVEVVIGGRF